MWDQKYYQQKRIEEKFQLNDEEIKSYFPIEKVTNGIISIYQSLFNLIFIKDENYQKWHFSVVSFSVFIPSLFFIF